MVSLNPTLKKGYWAFAGLGGVYAIFMVLLTNPWFQRQYVYVQSHTSPYLIQISALCTRINYIQDSGTMCRTRSLLASPVRPCVFPYLMSWFYLNVPSKMIEHELKICRGSSNPIPSKNE
jgi:hypothetical protein